MNHDQMWKNFDLGKELDVAGTFIYNGLRCFHEMRTLDNPEESFELLYNLSVGIERLLKVAVVFLEHDGTQDQESFEKSLITHNHLELLKRVRARTRVALSGTHNDFLGLLGTFYKSFRYDRFNLSPVGERDREQVEVRKFFEKHLNVEFHTNNETFPLPNLNTTKYKRFIGRVVGKITGELYKIVEERAHALNLYTWERRYESKAAKVFLVVETDAKKREITFEGEDLLWKEILIFFMNTKEKSGILSYLRSLEPLGFDKALAQDYLRCFQSEEAKRSVLDEMEALYEELEKPHDRLVSISLIGDPNIFFDSGDDEEGSIEADDEKDGS